MMMLMKASKETHWSVESPEWLVHRVARDVLMIVRRHEA